MLPVSVIIPVRNAEHLIEGCLRSIIAAEPAEVIVVDGLSTDRTLEIVKRFNVTILSDGGRGVPAARMLGVLAASHPIVALIDVDIEVPPGAFNQLFDEFLTGNYDCLQAGLISHSGPGYWGRALVNHHNNGRSKRWPGLMSTLFKKQVLIDNPLDERFRSGEDIEIRWRLKTNGYKMGVSQSVFVKHWFGDTYEFAKDQWVQDGKGLGRMVAKYGLKTLHLVGIPAAGALRGIGLSLTRMQPGWILYFLGYFWFNYTSIAAGLYERLSKPELWIPSVVNR